MLKVKVVDLYSASSWEPRLLRRSGVDHTVLPANNTTPAFNRSSPGGATTEWTVTAPADVAYYSLINHVRMKGWVGLVGWPTADIWPTKWSSVQLAVRRRTWKVRRSETSVLPLCYATNCYSLLCLLLNEKRTNCGDGNEQTNVYPGGSSRVLGRRDVRCFDCENDGIHEILGGLYQRRCAVQL